MQDDSYRCRAGQKTVMTAPVYIVGHSGRMSQRLGSMGAHMDGSDTTGCHTRGFPFIT